MVLEDDGKSVILLQIIDELKERGIPESQIIYINFEYEDYAFIKMIWIYTITLKKK